MIDSFQWHPMMGISKGVERRPLGAVGARSSVPSRTDGDRFDPSTVAAVFSSPAEIDSVRVQKVLELRAAIAAGTYRVSAPKLAEAMIAARALWP